MSKKYFTVEEANELLPLLEQELVTIQELQKNFQLKFKQLNQLKEHKYQSKSESIFTLESELEFLELQAQLHMKNIESKGVQLKGIELGLLDFPAIIDGEDVLLCWKQGESKVTHYHGEHEGFAGRKPIY
ncbi:DUF2203 domain-containing protein [Alkalihalobacterium alkalinitrilicum]|uniref:DUF2203 domain-containing protein n=1 Tax=Alkalihalobacterium alkalinitrilicum TaxID=427920 RepID=UPI000995A703|nr:DUF2203 domain-containing protein [Alkalihalobacterium alkalinitrilicum]